jgi:hypothetical protein
MTGHSNSCILPVRAFLHITLALEGCDVVQVCCSDAVAVTSVILSVYYIRQDISPRCIWVYIYIGTMASVPSSVQPLAAGCFSCSSLADLGNLRVLHGEKLPPSHTVAALNIEPR